MTCLQTFLWNGLILDVVYKICIDAIQPPACWHARNIYLVMELCSGGELFDRIIDAGSFTEAGPKQLVFRCSGTFIPHYQPPRLNHSKWYVISMCIYDIRLIDWRSCFYSILPCCRWKFYASMSTLTEILVLLPHSEPSKLYARLWRQSSCSRSSVRCTTCIKTMPWPQVVCVGLKSEALKLEVAATSLGDFEVFVDLRRILLMFFVTSHQP